MAPSHEDNASDASIYDFPFNSFGLSIFGIFRPLTVIEGSMTGGVS
jgi:hypothetical protein